MPLLEGWAGHTFDVAVIGAGAAGLATARHLMQRRPDLSVIVLEATARIGGRACTLPGEFGIDLGCGWLHGAQDNAWTSIGEAMGFTIDRTPAPWNRVMRDYGMPEDERRAARGALNDFFERAESELGDGADPPLSHFLPPNGRWNAFIGAIATYINGAELENASTLDYSRYEPGRPPDWRVFEGYGRLIAQFGEPVPVVAATVVSGIAYHGRQGVTIETSRGTVQCRAAVVTVSSTCLAEEAIRFDPPLPEKHNAAAGVPLGVANKIFLDVAPRADLPTEAYLHGALDRVATGSYHLRPFGRPLIECYYGGQLAREVEAMDAESAAAFAIEELVKGFGSGLRQQLTLRARSRWASNLYARGSYSYARPGKADTRAVLAAPVDGRLFFAGEACSPNRFSTAHGAYETGVATAEAIAASLSA